MGNFGYDAALPPHLRSFHVEASNWRLGFDAVLAWMEANDGEVVDIGPFKRGLRGSIISCLLEHRQPRPNMEIKNYYQPLGARGQFPECWRLFDAIQARPFHP